VAQILNKPTLATVATSGSYNDLINKPTIPAAQVNSDWNATSGVAEILNKPTIPAAVTKTSDLTNDGEDGINPFITAADIPPVTGFVPYTGATANVDLGTHTLSAKDLVINHSSGSGVAASITKGGAGEALTINKTSGSGNAMSVTGGVTQLDELHLTTDLADAYIASAATWNGKQDALVSGTNIKTINGNSVLGSGDLVVSGSNIYNADGALTSARTLTSGGFPLTFTGSNTAASAIARGLNLTHTLVANANNNVLVGLDIAPTFTNGAFTGVENIAQRITTNVTNAINAAPTSRVYRINSAAGNNLLSVWNNGAVSIGTNSTSITSGVALDINAGFGARVNVTGGLNITSSATFGTENSSTRILMQNDGFVRFGQNTFRSSIGLQQSASGSIDIYDLVLTTNSHNNVAKGICFVTGHATGGLQMKMFSSGNLLLQNGGTFTDAGFKLDVNGTFRVASGVNALIDVNSTYTTLNRNLGTAQIMRGLSITPTSGTFAFGSGSGNKGTMCVGDGTNFAVLGYNWSPTGAKAVFAGITQNGNQLPIAIYGRKFELYNTSNVAMTMFDTTANFVVQTGGTHTDVASSKFTINSTTQGFLPPRMTTTQKNAIATPAAGLVVYDTTLNKLCLYTTTWETITSL
jgi:hypothetical protein